MSPHSHRDDRNLDTDGRTGEDEGQQGLSPRLVAPMGSLFGGFLPNEICSHPPGQHRAPWHFTKLTENVGSHTNLPEGSHSSLIPTCRLVTDKRSGREDVCCAVTRRHDYP